MTTQCPEKIIENSLLFMNQKYTVMSKDKIIIKEFINNINNLLRKYGYHLNEKGILNLIINNSIQYGGVKRTRKTYDDSKNTNNNNNFSLRHFIKDDNELYNKPGTRRRLSRQSSPSTPIPEPQQIIRNSSPVTQQQPSPPPIPEPQQMIFRRHYTRDSSPSSPPDSPSNSPSNSPQTPMAFPIYKLNNNLFAKLLFVIGLCLIVITHQIFKIEITKINKEFLNEFEREYKKHSLGFNSKFDHYNIHKGYINETYKLLKEETASIKKFMSETEKNLYLLEKRNDILQTVKNKNTESKKKYNDFITEISGYKKQENIINYFLKNNDIFDKLSTIKLLNYVYMTIYQSKNCKIKSQLSKIVNLVKSDITAYNVKIDKECHKLNSLSIKKRQITNGHTQINDNIIVHATNNSRFYYYPELYNKGLDCFTPRISINNELLNNVLENVYNKKVLSLYNLCNLGIVFMVSGIFIERLGAVRGRTYNISENEVVN